MRILILTKSLPYPPISGLRLRNYNILQRVGKEHEVWFLAFSNGTNEDEKTHLLNFCENVITVPWGKSGALDKPIDFFRYLFSGTPPDLRLRMVPDMIAKIRELCHEINFDIIEIIDSDMAKYHEVVPEKGRSKIILTFIDVQYLQYDRIYQLEPKLTRKLRLWLHSRMLRRWEPRYPERYDHCISVSPVDRSILLKDNPQLKIDVIPNGIDTQFFQPLPPQDSSKNLIYVGNMGYRPNIDAMIYFCDEILPLIRHSIPDVEMWIVGIDPAREILDLERDHIHVTGHVDDVRPFYQQSDVCVIPLRAGSGTRLKILESMALGRPVVSTTIGYEGINAVHGEHILIADDPARFAEMTTRLLTDIALRNSIVKKARRFVESNYDWDIIVQSLMQTYSKVLGKKSNANNEH